MGELIFNVALLLFFVVMTINSFTIDISQDIGALIWPLFMLAIIDILLIVKIANIFKKIPEEDLKFDPIAIFNLKNPNIGRLIFAFIWVILYAIILPYGGYVLTTFIFCIGVSWILGIRSILKSILLSLAITAILFAIFVWGLGVYPPRGIGPLENFSRWLEYLF